MSSNRLVFHIIARQVQPVLHTLFYTFGAILLGVAIIIALLLFIDWLVRRSKSKKQKIETVSQPVIRLEEVKKVNIQQPEPDIPVKEEIIDDTPLKPEEPVVTHETIIETEEQPAAFSLQQNVESLAAEFKKSCAEKDLIFVVEIDDRTPPQIIGKKTWLNELLQQFFDIALQQTRQGNISLKVKMVKGNDKNATVQFLVTDTGSGLPSSLLRAVQEKDYSFQPEDAPLQSILIRLHEIKKSIEKEKGRLTLASRANEGSTIGLLIEFTL